MKKLVLIASAFIVLSGCGDSDAPIDIEIYQLTSNLGSPYVEVKVISLVDKIEVKEIEINRGNCQLYKIYRYGSLPKTITYGGHFSMTSSFECDPRQVDVTTDNGVWSFTY